MFSACEAPRMPPIWQPAPRFSLCSPKLHRYTCADQKARSLDPHIFGDTPDCYRGATRGMEDDRIGWESAILSIVYNIMLKLRTFNTNTVHSIVLALSAVMEQTTMRNKYSAQRTLAVLIKVSNHVCHIFIGATESGVCALSSGHSCDGCVQLLKIILIEFGEQFRQSWTLPIFVSAHAHTSPPVQNSRVWPCLFYHRSN